MGPIGWGWSTRWAVVNVVVIVIDMIGERERDPRQSTCSRAQDIFDSWFGHEHFRPGAEERLAARVDRKNGSEHSACGGGRVQDEALLAAQSGSEER